jgi:hypothetical protein
MAGQELKTQELARSLAAIASVVGRAGDQLAD